MKKKILSVLLSTAMVAALAAGCGANAAAPAADAAAPAADAAADAAAPAADTAAPAEDAAAPAADAAADAAAPAAGDEGKVLNIYCWNEEFKTRLTDHYPGYTETDATSGTIGDVTVKWNITPNQDNAYQNNLDENLLKQADASADDKIDIFLVEADYALKYVDTELAMPVKDLGLTDAELANQYKYTKDIVTDSNGNLKGVSWQGCPGVMIYSRDIAKEVFGSDDPAEVQKKFSDWATFNASAKELKDKGYSVMSSVNDSYRVYSNNVTSKWVTDGKITIDDNLMKWVDDSKELVDAGETKTYDLWSDDWSKGFYPEGKVFCYFGPAWFVDFSMAADTEGSIANAGGWGATEGPQGFYWGGTWIVGAAGTDNPTLVADIMRQLTTNEQIMTDIVKADNDFVNNKPAMEAMAADTSYSSKVLGGQNPLAMYCAGADKIDLSNISAYDQGCNEEFQNAMKNYFDGNATKEEALELFYKAVEEKYPELTH
ncbi:MAG: carbohydrate ABC transporter substrate-binding protein [Lachnospiraceae bacterium]|nr:carbohydrate ABC transporter substrate-binding protein [Lachnospiraceae bacterium]